MNNQPMSADNFWSIIENTNKLVSNQDAQENALRDELRKLTSDEIVAFEIASRQYQNAAYSWDLWGALYIIFDHSRSDHHFEDFLRWIVARGRSTYEAALANPDSLAKVISRNGRSVWCFFGELDSVVADVYKEKGGEGKLNDHHSEWEAGLDGHDPTGNDFEKSEEQLSARYPKLWRLFGRNFQGTRIDRPMKRNLSNDVTQQIGRYPMRRCRHVYHAVLHCCGNP